MRLKVGFKRFHKWLALIVAIQLFLWIISGLVFSFIDHEKVKGSFIYKQHEKPNIIQVIDFSKIINKFPQATEISQIALVDDSVIKIVIKNTAFVVDRKTLKPILIDQALIRKKAETYYRGKGRLKQIILLEHVLSESRAFELPSWRVTYEDDYSSQLYFSALSGEYQGVRTDSWRIFDFFMMLHFMDYGQRDNFNHGLIIVTSVLLLLLVISGIQLVFTSFSRSDFLALVNFLPIRENFFRVTLIDKQGKMRNIDVSRNGRLLDELRKNKIHLMSVCGGGGECGTCKVRQTDSLRKTNLATLSTTHYRLAENEIEDGYRLACQFYVSANVSIEIPIRFDV